MNHMHTGYVVKCLGTYKDFSGKETLDVNILCKSGKSYAWGFADKTNHYIVILETSEQAQDVLKEIKKLRALRRRNSYYISKCIYKKRGKYRTYWGLTKPDKNEFLARL